MQTDERDIAIYSKQWFLAAFSTTNLVANFGTKSFAVPNQIYADYFSVSLAVLAWFALAMYLGAILITPFFAWLFFQQKAMFRSLSVIRSLALMESFFVIVFSAPFSHI